MWKKVLSVSVLAALIILLTGGVLNYFGLPPFDKSSIPPIEPETHMKLRDEESYMNLKYIPTPEIEVFDISMDYGGNSVLFGSNTKKVTFIDSDGRLKWEETFETNPLQTKVSSCGNYVGIGTYGGRILFKRANQEALWEKILERPVTRLILSPSGRWLLAGSGGEAAESRVIESQISFFDRESRKEWLLDTGPLIELQLASGKEMIFYTEIVDIEDNNYRTVALDFDGEEIWALPNYRLRAMSSDGELLTMQQNNGMVLGYNSNLEELWRYELGFSSFKAFFNPRNNNLLVYNSENGKADNLFYFNYEGEKLWDTVIGEQSLITFSSDGEKIIYITGREADENFGKLILLNEEGVATKEFEITVQVEKVIAAEDADIVFLASKEGSVYQIDLTVENDR